MTARFTAPADLGRYAAYIFDFDGTLADTMPSHHVAWKHALKEGGASFEFTWPLFLSRAGMSMERTVEELAGQFEQLLNPSAISRRQREIFRELSRDTQAVTEVLDFARLARQTHPIAIASGNNRPEIERLLEIIKAKELFDVIVTPEDVKHGKPAPDMFLLAAERMGVNPSSCLVIEDGELGFEAARRAKMDYLVVAGPQPFLELQPSM